MPNVNVPSELPANVLKGIEQFNKGQFYACHDSLEKAWLTEKRPIRKLYQGILQIGVSLYHERNGNRRGACRLLQTGRDKIQPFTPVCLGIDIALLIDATREIQNYFTTHSDRLPERMHPKIQIIANT